MKLFTGRALILLAAAVSVAALAGTAAGSSEEELKAAAAAAGGLKKGKISQILRNFKLPKIFNFDKYKRTHGKQYTSHSEDVARSKNYFGRAFKVFISCVQYLWKRSTKYLTITEKADWTQAERDASFTYKVEHSTLHEYMRQQGQLDHPEPLSEEDESPAVELEEVEETLAEIVSRQGENPEFARIAAELVSADSRQSSRRKRDVVGAEEERRPVSLDELLMKDPNEDQSQLEPLEKLTNSIASNNPDYEQIEVFSEGVDDDGKKRKKMPRSMSKSERTKTLARKGKTYLTKVVSTAFSPFNMVTDLWKAQNRDKPDFSLPDEVFLDYRQSGCIYHPKSQGQCGSCYIFATTALYEYHQCKQSGKLVPFSEQYAVDCGKRLKLAGCDGGWVNQVGDFIDQYGLEQQLDYPYRGDETVECPYSSETPSRFMGHTKAREAKMKLLNFIQINNRNVIRETLEKFGPLVISVHSNDEMLDYGGGVDMLNNCRWFSGHSMQLVGHGRQDGLEYWLIRNSWGSDWGEKGYYKLSKGVSTRCMINIGYIEPKFDQKQATATKRKQSRRKLLQNKQRIAQFLDNFGV